MGNKLCAPLLNKKPYREDQYPRQHSKDSHLLRLWAEIFRVHGDEDCMRWERVSTDVVPVNISCIEDTPSTIFQVTAYNKHVEKIFDVKIIQPGTIICPATECFVHWRDVTDSGEWGLNFTTPSDAKRFRDCCTNPAQKFSRKANSASSLRLSPPKKIKNKERSISSPSSPVHPHGNDHLDNRTSSTHHSCSSVGRTSYNQEDIITKKERAATIPRGETETQLEPFKPVGILKPPSNSSVYDNVTGNVVLRRSPNGQPNHRKSMPVVSTSHVSFVDNKLLSEARPASAIHFTHKFYQNETEKENYLRARNSVTFGEKLCDESIGTYQNKGNFHIETAFVGDNFSPSDFRDNDVTCNVSYIDTTTTVLAPLPTRLSVSQKSSSSESPEWPSPPEPLTPLTPVNPECNVEFDSDILKRMLQSLPVSPEESNMSKKGGLVRTKSLNTHDRVNLKSDFQKCSPNASAKVDRTRPNTLNNNNSKSKQTRLLIEEELRLRNKCVWDSYGQDNYPDSGIGGMSGEGSGWSTGSHQLGLDVNPSKIGQGSSGGSSHGSSSSGRHSDMINTFSDTSNLRLGTSRELWDDDGAESDDSIHTMTEAESRVSFKHFGAIRKAGWLVVKNWLIHKKRRLELAPKRKWKRYWVCLKGTVLLFYDCNEQTTVTDTSIPRHILVIEGAIAQAIPEHPKRDNIFSLSTAFGDAYLFEASSLMELESWICSVHSACASSFARQHGKDNTLRLLKSELHKLETNIDVDVKMKKMAELQLTVVTDPRSRQAIIRQIGQWEENLEKLYIEQYRFRCYIASLQGTELPNPKVLLASASKKTKSSLGRLGIFTVTSFHALVAARKPLVVPNIYGKAKHHGGMLSPKGDGTFKYNLKTSPGHSPSSQEVYKATEIDEVVANVYRDSPETMSVKSDGGSQSLSWIALPNNQTILVGVDGKTLVQDLLVSVCNKRQLDPADHYVRVTVADSVPGKYIVPDPNENIKKMKYETIEVCQKTIVYLQLVKSQTDVEFGFVVEAELAEDYEKDDELRLYVSHITTGSVAEKSGLSVGDEILVINGKIVSELDMVYIEELLHESQSLTITVRSLRTNKHSVSVMAEQICPPPPSQTRIPPNVLGNLIVPGPDGNGDPSDLLKKPESLPDLSGNQIDNLLKNADQVTSICRTGSEASVLDNHVHCNTKPLSEAQKLRKVIMELIDTERAYVKDLLCLTERYLEPLKEETFLTSDEINQLFGNIQEIVQFQQQFLLSLEEAIHLEENFFSSEDPKVFRRVLFSLGGSFLFYANHFKVYSSFCASHSRSQKILNPVANDALKAFLCARNPRQQHSATLESYLIKPIQRILKYPLLLQQLCQLTDKDTDEHHHLTEANKGMEAVAEHINEMQKIFEEYGAVFDELSKMFRDLYPHKKVVDLSVGELQMYGTVEWCNICDSLGKVKKGLDLENIVFVFKSAVVFICREKVKKKIKSKDKNSKGPTEVYESQEKFRTIIPVQEVQVQSGKVNDIDNHYWWDLIHCRSDKEGRPERLYQFCNSSLEAKTDFMKIIRQTIRESVRKMTLPNGGQVNKKSYVPYGGKRLESLSSNVRTLSKKRGSKSSQSSETDRHSLEFEEKITLLVDAEEEPSFRTRSKTVGDLTDESDLQMATSQIVSKVSTPERNSTCSSNSSLSSRTSAKLTHASNNPVNYSSVSQIATNSPVWKPRNEANLAYVEERRQGLKCDLTVKTCSEKSQFVQTSFTTFKDTEC